MRSLTFIAVAIWIAASEVPTAAAPGGTLLCQYEMTWVPCSRLRRAAHVWAYRLKYRPTKWIPLWPNNAVFGGTLSEEHYEIDPEAIITQPFQNSKLNIETISFIPKFDHSYVDRGLAAVSTWMGYDTATFLRLINVSEAYHGDKVFDAWTKAADAGIQCRVETAETWDEEVEDHRHNLERHCVFARKQISRSGYSIEYCTFEEDLQSGIRDSPTCTRVALERGRARQILATRYTTYAFQGGDYAGEFMCTVPAVTRQSASDHLETFIKGLIGVSSKYASTLRADTYAYKAEGINIEDRAERIFLRVFLSGSVYEQLEKNNRISIRMSMNYYYTVSAQSSDDMTNYREPNAAMSKRIRNRFEAAAKTAMRNLARGSECKWD